MTGTVGNEFDQSFAGLTTEFLIKETADRAYKIDIRDLIVPADVVGLPRFPSVKNQVEGTAMVLHKEPVANILAVPVDGQFITRLGIENHQRDQLLGKLIRSVVVRAIRRDNLEAIGRVVGPHEMIGGSLGGRIRRIGTVGRLLGKIALGPEGTIHLVRRDVMKSKLPRFIAAFQGGAKQIESTDYVGFDKRRRAFNRPIDMRFSREMDYGVDVVFFETRRDTFGIANIDFLEGIVGRIFQRDQTGQVAGIGEAVDINEEILGVFGDQL